MDLAPRTSGLLGGLRDSWGVPIAHVDIWMGGTDEDWHDGDTARVQFVHGLASEIVEDGHIVLGAASHCESQIKR